MTATLAPRMNVDNGVTVYRYDGSGPVATKKDRAPLFEARWVPASRSLYPDRGASAESKKRAKANKSAAATAAPKAYRPPGARGLAGGGSLAASIRAERERDNSKAGSVQKRGAGGVVGAAPEGF